jgi:hypothetical protein
MAYFEFLVPLFCSSGLKCKTKSDLHWSNYRKRRKGICNFCNVNRKLMHNLNLQWNEGVGGGGGGDSLKQRLVWEPEPCLSNNKLLEPAKGGKVAG